MASGVRKERPVVEVGGRLSVDSEVLRTLPEGLLFHYEQVWMRVVGTSNGRPDAVLVANARAVDRTSTGQTATRGGAHRGKKLQGASERQVIASEAALRFKRKVDAELRKVNRMMRAWLAPSGEVGVSLGRRCSVCKRFGEDEWVYCPWDGKPMEEREA